MKPEFNVGDRVRVRIATDVIKESQVLNDEGYVRQVVLHFAGTRHERITYWVRLDGPYCPFLGKDVDISRGFNVVEEVSSIARV